MKIGVFLLLLLSSIITFVLLIAISFQMLTVTDESDYEQVSESDEDFERGGLEHVHGTGDAREAEAEAIAHPIIIWWTPFTGQKGHTKACGDVKCFFTVDRHYQNHPQTKVFMFYGSDFEPSDIPLPRQPHHEWALLHEESPKNEYLFSHELVMVLFNHTSTFKRESDFPLTLQYLSRVEDLQSTKYLVPTAEKTEKLSELALVNYVHSDCGAPSDRDHLVRMLQRFIKVDSYGQCLHNKDLPEHLTDALRGMDHPEFFKVIAQYKFTLAVENGICDDYITEKIWRPWIVGSVPIILGSPKIRDYLPAEDSAILLDDFSSIEDLVRLIVHLNSSNADYEKYLAFKHTGVTNTRLRQEMRERVYTINNDDFTKPNFVDAYECFVCKRIHENIARAEQGKVPLPHQATVNHYGCPEPLVFKDKGGGDSLQRVRNARWSGEWTDTKYQGRALLEFISRGRPFTNREFHKRAHEIRKSLLPGSL